MDNTGYATLSPDLVIDAVEATGRRSDARVLALNSYENRVYQVGIEGGAPLVAKFYRPHRWSDATIREEHAFARELLEAELPVVAPLAADDGETLLRHGEFRFALYPRVGGHVPDLDQPEQLLSLGRILGRLHAIGASRAFAERPAIDVEGYAVASRRHRASGVCSGSGKAAASRMPKGTTPQGVPHVSAARRPAALSSVVPCTGVRAIRGVAEAPGRRDGEESAARVAWVARDRGGWAARLAATARGAVGMARSLRGGDLRWRKSHMFVIVAPG